MMSVSETEFLKLENQKLRKYITLISTKIEFLQRVSEVEQNFSNSSDSERIIAPILKRISKIKHEMKLLEQELNLN